MRTSSSSDAESATRRVVGAAAEASDVDPLALPTLNDRVDPDCVDPLVSEFPTGAPEGVRMAVEVTFGDVSVLLRDDEDVEVYPAGREPNGVQRSVTIDHDWTSTDSLLQSIGEMVTETTDEPPGSAITRLIQHLDADAVNRLLQPLANGSRRSDSRLLLSIDGHEIAVDPSGSIVAEPSIAVFKRSGAALLVVGSVPEQGFDRVSATLLGDSEEGSPPAFVLHGRDVETARRRLSKAGIPPSEGVVLDHHTKARGTTAASTEELQASSRGPEVVPVAGEMEVLPGAVDETVEDAPSSRPGQFRLCVDSLRSMIDSSDVETTRETIQPICRTVRERQGHGHFLLPVDADSEAVETLAPLFDGVVELRTGDVGLEQRWRLTGTGHETVWFPLR